MNSTISVIMGLTMYSHKEWIKQECGIEFRTLTYRRNKTMDEQHLPADDIQPHNEDRWWP